MTRVLKGWNSPFVGLCVSGAALLWHATRYDFFCDDGYIALRYSQSLLSSGELVYNAGERVEGFTSPLWVLLVALLGVFGGSLVVCAKLLGAASALGTLAVTRYLWRYLAPQHPPVFAFLVLLLLVLSPPFAAWTLGGLEAPLFALGVTSTLVLLARAYDNPDVNAWVQCGVVAGLSALARPEGMALALVCVGLALWQAVAAKKYVHAWACFLPVVMLLGGYLAFRLAYYGYPLPNTYYVKTSGNEVRLVRRGVKYVGAMARQFGVPTCAALIVALALPLLEPKRHMEQARARPSFGVLLLLSRVLVVGFVAYLVRIGGDFLDLYRFVVPILPVALCLVLSEMLNLWRTLVTWLQNNRRVLAFGSPAKQGWVLRSALGVVMSLLLLSYGKHSLWMFGRSIDADAYSAPRSAPRRPEGVESIPWTRKAALQWAALGRAIASHSRHGDSMAMGAAGAAPFHAGLPNLDLYGLTDSQVAHRGHVVGTRPGHQRFASNDYIRRRKPTFLFIQAGGTQQPQRDAYWNAAGYESATLKVSRKRHGAVETHYVAVLVHHQRAKALKKHPEWKFL
jgi:arabinofuranosyltransferase